jgi:hypothetical protein
MSREEDAKVVTEPVALLLAEVKQTARSITHLVETDMAVEQKLFSVDQRALLAAAGLVLISFAAQLEEVIRMARDMENESSDLN